MLLHVHGKSIRDEKLVTDGVDGNIIVSGRGDEIVLEETSTGSLARLYSPGGIVWFIQCENLCEEFGRGELNGFPLFVQNLESNLNSLMTSLECFAVNSD